MHTVEKGRIAEAKVVAILIANGLEVFLPVFGNSSCDLVVFDKILYRIEVKYSSQAANRTSYEVDLRQSRHNLSVTVKKRFNADNSDILAIYIAPLDKIIFTASRQYHGRTAWTVDTRKLNRYTWEGAAAACQSGLNLDAGNIPGRSTLPPSAL